MKAKDLLRALKELDADTLELPVAVWLPGSRIDLGSAFVNGGELLIEGNVRE